MISLNMLPDVKREYLNARRLEAKVIAACVLLSAIAAGIVVLLALWVYGAQTLQKSSLTSSIQKNETKLQGVKDINKYVTIQNQLANVSSLHEKKLIYSRVFDVLPQLNPKAPNSVTISSLTIDSTVGSMIFEGQTTTFTALETFRDTLRNAQLEYTQSDAKTSEPLFSLVTVDNQSIGKDSGGKSAVGFKISTTYNAAWFARTTQSLGVSVPTKETTQSKEDAPDVFGKSTIQTEGRQ